MAKIKVSELALLDENKVNDKTSLLAVDNNQSYQLRYGFLSSNLSSNLYRPIAETVSAECDIQQQKDDIAALLATSNSLCAEIQLSTQTLTSEINNKIDKTTIATSTDLGLIKVGYDTDLTAKNYAVQLTEESNAYVHVPWEGGSGGDDTRINMLASVSSYYTDDSYNNKVLQVQTEATNNHNANLQLIRELSTKIITGDDPNETNSLSGDFRRFSSAVAKIEPVLDDDNKISIESGVLFDLITTDNFSVMSDVLSSAVEILSSDNIFKVGYLAIGLELTSITPTSDIVVKNRYIANENNKSIACIEVHNAGNSTASVTIGGNITYIHTSKEYTI